MMLISSKTGEKEAFAVGYEVGLRGPRRTGGGKGRMRAVYSNTARESHTWDSVRIL